MKTVSIYSGCGGMDLGFKQAGFEIIYAADFDKDAVATYKRNLGPEIVHGDVSNLAFPSADVVIGGPPCQGFSQAGRQNPSDPRSQHILTFLDVVKTVRPRAFVMENVPALLGPRWADIRSEWMRRADDMSYTVSSFILNAADYEVPQNRKRAFFVGLRDSQTIDPPAMLQPSMSVRQAISQLPPSAPAPEAKITLCVNPVMRKSEFAGMLFNGRGRPVDLERPSPTILAANGNSLHIIDQNVLDGASNRYWVTDYHTNPDPTVAVPSFLRRLTLEEAAAIQGFPVEWKFCGAKTHQFRQVGNAVPPPLASALGSTLRGLLD
jgi:DNA (cytosine-5)-methyltransferase 1